MPTNYVKNIFFNFFSFFLIAFYLYIFIALVTYNPLDPAIFHDSSSETITNLGGPLGANISDILFTIFGQGSFLILFIGVIWALQTIFFEDPYATTTKIAIRCVCSFILLISFCSILEYYFDNSSGGVLGKIFFLNLSYYLGQGKSLINLSF